MADSLVGAWDCVYNSMKNPSRFGGGNSYKFAIQQFVGCKTVEDWGCGGGWFKHAAKQAGAMFQVKNVDGSKSPFADEVADLTTYHSQADGVFLRHVLEHNHDWQPILKNALDSARSKLVIALHTPMVAETVVLNTVLLAHGIEVPTISFSYKDLEKFLTSLKAAEKWQIRVHDIPDHETDYGKETAWVFTAKTPEWRFGTPNAEQKA